nr:hypothetical protein [Fodinicola acaciae]
MECTSQGKHEVEGDPLLASFDVGKSGAAHIGLSCQTFLREGLVQA